MVHAQYPRGNAARVGQDVQQQVSGVGAFDYARTRAFVRTRGGTRTGTGTRHDTGDFTQRSYEGGEKLFAILLWGSVDGTVYLALDAQFYLVNLPLLELGTKYFNGMAILLSQQYQEQTVDQIGSVIPFFRIESTQRNEVFEQFGWSLQHSYPFFYPYK
jgi:hypothetical protein